ncbi:hypothetical protein BN1086_04775 [Citrobacter koseri]|uniref:Uncharacterized protein n=1 Tax=Citrobacter koseri TaxID=545 RepID=A0A078LQC8_CITKO|nr:hypothetical protein BN1086_04775 [Citrobacter koseri]
MPQFIFHNSNTFCHHLDRVQTTKQSHEKKRLSAARKITVSDITVTWASNKGHKEIKFIYTTSLKIRFKVFRNVQELFCQVVL